MGRTNYITRLFLLIFSVNLMGGAGCESHNNNHLLEDEVAIYVELASSDEIGDIVGEGGDIVVSNGPIEALGIKDAGNVRSVLPGTPDSVIADFLRKTKSDFDIKEDLPINDRFLLRAYQSGDGQYKELTAHHTFSRVGFDSKRINAIVYYYRGCSAPLCGEGGLFLLQKVGSTWVVTAESEKIKG